MARVKTPKSHAVGIPKLATKIRSEKATEVIPIKVQLSLKKAIPEPRSTWIRELLIKTLAK